MPFEKLNIRQMMKGKNTKYFVDNKIGHLPKSRSFQNIRNI